MADLQCENCGTTRGADDVFCESCGMDFVSGSMPEPEAAAETEAPETSETSIAEAETGEVKLASEESASAKLHISIAVDKGQYDKVVKEGEVDFPDPVPEMQTLELPGDEFHIGRSSQSRAIHPDLDILELTGDEAVSSRHAVIKISDDGEHTLTDVGSTNGTTVGAVENKLLTVGEANTVEPGTDIFLGAWTKLTILEAP